MDPLRFVDGIPLKEKPSSEDKESVVQALRTFYCRFLSEDPMEGTAFDHQVLDALDLILLHPELWELKKRLRAETSGSPRASCSSA
jgi:hypothetical protein